MHRSAAAPAKLNLSLAIVGREADGFHRLVSCVVPVALADTLTFEPRGDRDSLSCDDPALTTDASNLVLRAAAVFRAARPDSPRGHFHLAKRIPHGAGLGGGSSDAAAALRLLNDAAGAPFDTEQLRGLAAQVGSDCAFFIRPVPAIMRGRGEQLAPLPAGQAAALSGRQVLLIKPSFGVATAEAYGWFIREGRVVDVNLAEQALAAAGTDLAALVALGNALQAPVFARHPEMSAGLLALRERMGIVASMTGSGSACFALVDRAVDLDAVRAALSPSWGSRVWVAQTALV